MSRPAGPRFRLVTVLLAALQLLLPGVAAMADAGAERESRSPGGVAHLEAEGGEHCPAVHEDDCALCHFLTVTRLRAPRAPAIGAVSPGSAVSAPPVVGAPSVAAAGALLPRAPPAA